MVWFNLPGIKGLPGEDYVSLGSTTKSSKVSALLFGPFLAAWRATYRHFRSRRAFLSARVGRPFFLSGDTGEFTVAVALHSLLPFSWLSTVVGEIEMIWSSTARPVSGLLYSV